MQIESNTPLNNLVQGVETTPTAGSVNQEKENAPEQRAAETEMAEGTPDYQLSLSEQSKQALAELDQSEESDATPPNTDLDESEAAQLANQIAAQLSQQPNASISNLAMQRAVDLFM